MMILAKEKTFVRSLGFFSSTFATDDRVAVISELLLKPVDHLYGSLLSQMAGGLLTIATMTLGAVYYPICHMIRAMTHHLMVSV